VFLYRVAPQSHAGDLSGEGARLYGGRWNPKGMAAVYTAENPSQALLEYLPHFRETCAPPDLVLVTIEVPDTLSIQDITKENLPANWDARPPIPATAMLGEKWLRESSFIALRVPSVMLPYGKAWNLVLNPRHPKFAEAYVTEIVSLPVDPRFISKSIQQAPLFGDRLV
jgi:RES domain-containing protein